jgi:hypothetical protein
MCELAVTLVLAFAPIDPVQACAAAREAEYEAMGYDAYEAYIDCEMEFAEGERWNMFSKS